MINSSNHMEMQRILEIQILMIMTITRTINKQSLAAEVAEITLYNAIKDTTFINRLHHTNPVSNNIVIRVQRKFTFPIKTLVTVVLYVNIISAIRVINIILAIVEGMIRIIMINSIMIIRDTVKVIMKMLIIRGMALQIATIIEMNKKV